MQQNPVIEGGMAGGMLGVNPGIPGAPGMVAPPTTQGPIMSNPAEGTQQFCLRWNSFPATVATQLATLRAAEDFVDVTLACDGRQLKAHKLVLSACSPYFMQLFKSTPCQHPVIFLRDVGFRQLVALLEFMYAGEVNVSQVELPALLRTAEALQVRGLADTNANNNCPAPPQPQKPQTFSPQYAPGPVIGQSVMAGNVQQQQQQQLHPGSQSQQHPLQPSLDQQQQQQQMVNVAGSGNSGVLGDGNLCANPSTSAPTSSLGMGNQAKKKEDNASDSNDSDEEFEIVAQDEMKDYIADGTLNEQMDDQDIFGGTEDSGVYPLDIHQADLGSSSMVGSQSDEESSEDEDEDEDGECKEFTYQSDASYNQESKTEAGGSSNGEGNVAGPSGFLGHGAKPEGLDGEVEAGKVEEGKDGELIPPTGSARNRLSRSLWPPGIPYHGPQQCPYCPRILSNVGNWRKHVLTMHFAREKVYKCQHCASSFRTAEYLQKHYVRVHNYPQKMTRRKYVEQT